MKNKIHKKFINQKIHKNKGRLDKFSYVFTFRRLLGKYFLHQNTKQEAYLMQLIRPPPPPLECMRGPHAHSHFLGERGYFLAGVSGNLPGKEGVFVIANGNQYPR